MINLLKKPQNQNKRLVALIDGEHYPDVNYDAISILKKSFKGLVCGIIFLGGTEKLVNKDPEKFYGLDIFMIKNLDSDFLKALQFFRPDIAYDLSDQPVVNHQIRMKIASYCFKQQCSYMGPDFYFEYEPKSLSVNRRSLGIIGTGKRIGKTAVSSFIANLISEKSRVCIVAMGRGGPQKPEVIRRSRAVMNPGFLLEISRKGMHASSDYIEDAFFSRADTVGCRRCGGGFGGKFFMSNIAAGIKAAQSLGPDNIIIEGSGASIPPVRTDFNICVIGGNQSWDEIVGYLGIYRILISDIVFLTMCQFPPSRKENTDYLVSMIKKISPQVKIIKSVFRPEPVYDIKNKKIFVVMTSDCSIENIIRSHLEEKYNCRVVKISFNLSNRDLLIKELNECREYDMLVTELKAASVDMVTEFAYKNKKEINYMNNVPVITEGRHYLDDLIYKMEN